MFKDLYYILKPLFPRRLQLFIRRLFLNLIKRKYNDIWPIDPASSSPPKGWNAWPAGKKFALILTHDVEKDTGQNKCYKLAQLELELGFRSSYNFVPERYNVSKELRDYLVQNKFEVGVHGLNHDGKLYSSKSIFLQRSKKINHYIKEWNAVGFRSPAMHHNLEWIHELDIEYDASTFDTDPFEPVPDGMKTIFPFWVQHKTGNGGYIELPYTLPQDSTLFLIMKEKTIDIWKKKLDWIVEKGGMALINVHPDYIHFDSGKQGLEEYPADFYRDFLTYILQTYKGLYWHVLPKELSKFWKEEIVKK